MKITKRQLKRIIKEEATKLSEDDTSERAVGLYANQSLIGKLTSALNELEGQVYEDAMEDLEDDQDASEQARMVLVSVISNWMGNSGYLDVEDALAPIRSYNNMM